MDHIEFLLEKANLKRQLRDGRIDRATFDRRFADLLHRAAGLPSPGFDSHVEAALEVVR